MQNMTLATAIDKKLADFETAEMLAKNSTLTKADINSLSAKVNKAMGKRAKALLDEL